MGARASLFRRFTDTDVHGTGSVRIWKTRHKISVDVRIFFTAHAKQPATPWANDTCVHCVLFTSTILSLHHYLSISVFVVITFTVAQIVSIYSCYLVRPTPVLSVASIIMPLEICWRRTARLAELACSCWRDNNNVRQSILNHNSNPT